ncbi:MAG: fused MFS/spermidine synthase [Candidatus Uhrbacteria bacterium]
MNKYLIEWTVFICGAVVMILELVGSRILAPHVGASLMVWTSLIGIILGSLSVGYYWGGKLADKNARLSELAQIIFIGALLVVCTALLKESVLNLCYSLFQNLYLTTLVATCILFAPASVALGMVSPYAAKLKMLDTAHAGSTIGSLYALSTIGSIVGTFLAGFFLIAFFGSTIILYVLAALLVLNAILIHRQALLLKGIVLVLIVGIGSTVVIRGAFARLVGVVDVDTNYQRVQIYPTTYRDRSVRLLRTDFFSVQSGMFLDGDSSELVFDYTKMYDLVGQVQASSGHALLIGGAAYSYPKAYLKKFPAGAMDVVELDPRLTELAHQYFGLKDDARLRIFHEDGRVFLNTVSPATYDSILVDAYSSLSIPYQLATREAVQKMHDALRENGAVLVNIVGSIEGGKGEFFRAEYATYKSVFPRVYVFWVKSDQADEVQNLMLVATKSDQSLLMSSDDPEISQYLKQLWGKEIKADMNILTDEHAPVDWYMQKMYQ